MLDYKCLAVAPSTQSQLLASEQTKEMLQVDITDAAISETHQPFEFNGGDVSQSRGSEAVDV